MQLIEIDPACVVVADRLRAIDADYVDFLAESIGRRGLDTPIRVTEADAQGFHRLIAGAHRHAAALQLGLKSIPAIPFSGDELQAEMLEIEENLAGWQTQSGQPHHRAAPSAASHHLCRTLRRHGGHLLASALPGKGRGDQ
jgi:ParB-like chromosome segregation protein Spo0J